jgi:chemotaxis response regulator CheB
VLPGGRRAGLKAAGGLLTLDLRTPDPDCDILASAIRTVRRPAAVLLSGAARRLDALAEGRDRMTALVVQDPATCAEPALPGAALAAGLAPTLLTVPADLRRSRAA